MNITSSRFLKLVLVALVIGSALGILGDEAATLRGDRVGWARLKTPSSWWKRHAEGDHLLMEFLRDKTSLNLDPEWHQVDCEDLADMCNYPLIFTQEVDSMTNATTRANIAEYIRRGGFLLIDTCINPLNNPDPDVTFRTQTGWLKEVFPAAKIVSLPPEHPIFHCHYDFPDGKPPHTIRDVPSWTKHSLYGIQIGNRLVGVFTMSGLQCGWARLRQPEEHRIACMKMLVNIYVYAMLQGGEAGSGKAVDSALMPPQSADNSNIESSLSTKSP